MRINPISAPRCFAVFREFRQGFRNGLEQDSVEDFLIPEDKGIQQIGDGEDDMEVRYGKQVLSPVFDPLLFFKKLALGAVPVSAGVVRDQFRSAVLALVHVAALSRRCGRSRSPAWREDGSRAWDERSGTEDRTGGRCPRPRCCLSRVYTTSVRVVRAIKDWVGLRDGVQVQGTHDFREVLFAHVEVDRGRPDRGVAEQDLNRMQIDAGLQQMRGEAVPERMAACRLRDPGFCSSPV